jgi:hypothetical protein
MPFGYFERGGLRWGRTFWMAGSNATWPFATLRLTPEILQIEVGVWPLKRTFVFAQSEVKTFRRRWGLFSVGVQIEHGKLDYPPIIVFWTFHSRRLLAAAQAAGYSIQEGATSTGWVI